MRGLRFLETGQKGWGLGSSSTRHVKWFRGGLEFEADRLLYHSTLGLRVIRKNKKELR